MRVATIAVVALLLSATFTTAQVPAKVAMDRRLPTIKFSQVPLMDALDFFRDSTDANFVVDWRALEEVGVSRETPVSLTLNLVSTRVALNTTLESAAPGLLSYYVDENVIHITTRAKADAKMMVVIYPVQDLLVEIPDFKGPSLNLSDNIGGQSGRNNGGNADRGLFDNNQDRDEEKSKTRAERAQDLIDLIQETIRPDIWNVNGGKASIRYFNGSLIVTAPRAVQEAIGGPLD